MKIIYHHRTRATDAQRIHILELVKAFEELGHEVRIVSLVRTNAKMEDAERDAGEAFWKKCARRVPFSYDLLQLAYNLIGIPLLLSQVLRYRPAFLYERYSLLNFTGVVVARLLGIPLILEVNSPFAIEQARDRDIYFCRFASWSERMICRLASKVVVVSTPLARILSDCGVAAGKIEVMPNGVSLAHFGQRDASTLRCELGFANQIVIGFVGWFRNWHGLESLLEAFHGADLARENAMLLLIGDGPAMPDLRRFVANHKLEEYVHFTGPLPHARVPDYLSLIDIAVQPAANEYCCPMKLIEYMALGKPIVAPRQENICELLEEGSEALFFEPGNAASMGDALQELVRDRNMAKRLGEAARTAIDKRRYLWIENGRRVVRLASELPVVVPDEAVKPI